MPGRLHLHIPTEWYTQNVVFPQSPFRTFNVRVDVISPYSSILETAIILLLTLYSNAFQPTLLDRMKVAGRITLY